MTGEIPIQILLRSKDGDLHYMMQAVNDAGEPVYQISNLRKVDASMSEAVRLAVQAVRAGIAVSNEEYELQARIAPNPYETGLRDAKGDKIMAGDVILFRHSVNTTEEYRDPLFKVVWDAPQFRLEHTGGGKNSDTPHHRFKMGEGNRFIIYTSAEKTNA